MSFESFVLSSFKNVIEPECDVIFAICAVFMAVVAYIILCGAAPNICGIHLHSNKKDNVCLYCLQLRLLDIPFLLFFFFFFVTTRRSLDDSWKIHYISMNSVPCSLD